MRDWSESEKAIARQRAWKHMEDHAGKDAQVAFTWMILGLRLHESHPQFAKRLYRALMRDSGNEKIIAMVDQFVALEEEIIRETAALDEDETVN